ncbi:hypothetical protein GCM10010236_79100 [Streptomyces eurythermus]|nr:hypothetical protein GCM10010236_79100 [Streptomyces eurythermus]
MPSADTATAPSEPRATTTVSGPASRSARASPRPAAEGRGLAAGQHRGLLHAGEEYADARQQGADIGCRLLRAPRRATRRAAFETAVTFDGPGQ